MRLFRVSGQRSACWLHTRWLSPEDFKLPKILRKFLLTFDPFYPYSFIFIFFFVIVANPEIYTKMFLLDWDLFGVHSRALHAHTLKFHTKIMFRKLFVLEIIRIILCGNCARKLTLVPDIGDIRTWYKKPGHMMSFTDASIFGFRPPGRPLTFPSQRKRNFRENRV